MMREAFDLIEDDNFKINHEIIENDIDYSKEYNINTESKFNETQINLLIKEVKNYLNKTNYDDELKNYLTLIIVSFIEMNGKDITDVIYKTFKKTLIYFEQGTTSELGNKYGLIGLSELCEGITSLGIPTNLWTNKQVIVPKTMILIGKNDLTPIELLDCLTHEFRHSVTSIRKTNYYESSNVFIQRLGLSKFEYNNQIEIPFSVNVMLDEAFNTYFTEILVNQILSYKKIYIENEEINQLLKTIKNPFKLGYYYSNSYLLSKQLIQPLTDNNELCKEINKQTIKGNTNLLYLDEIGEQLEYVIEDLYNLNNNNYNEQQQLKENINYLKAKILKRGR